jgi:hypothetical protein
MGRACDSSVTTTAGSADLARGVGASSVQSSGCRRSQPESTHSLLNGQTRMRSGGCTAVHVYRTQLAPSAQRRRSGGCTRAQAKLMQSIPNRHFLGTLESPSLTAPVLEAALLALPALPALPLPEPALPALLAAAETLFRCERLRRRAETLGVRGREEAAAVPRPLPRGRAPPRPRKGSASFASRCWCSVFVSLVKREDIARPSTVQNMQPQTLRRGDMRTQENARRLPAGRSSPSPSSLLASASSESVLDSEEEVGPSSSESVSTYKNRSARG